MTDNKGVPALGPGCRRLLLALARESIEAGLAQIAPVPLPSGHLSADRPAAALDPGACFVTLREGVKLRGCCGTLRPRRPLAEDVWHNSQASAFGDQRMTPVTADELDRLHIQISVLSAMEPVEAQDEAELISQLEPGRHGVLLEYRQHHATYLPSVWRHLGLPERFLAELKTKAGLAENFWADEARWYRYRTVSFAE